jgi:hypothetical protein
MGYGIILAPPCQLKPSSGILQNLLPIGAGTQVATPLADMSRQTGAFAMDVTPAGLVNAAVEMKQAQTAQAVQISVLKQAMDVQASTTLSLLQGVTGNLPLANTGSLGTQVNQLV